jgi:hypothetical protein
MSCMWSRPVPTVIPSEAAVLPSQAAQNPSETRFLKMSALGSSVNRGYPHLDVFVILRVVQYQWESDGTYRRSYYANNYVAGRYRRLVRHDENRYEQIR